MVKYTMEMLYPLIVFKDNNATNERPLRSLHYFDSLRKLSNFNTEKQNIITQELVKLDLITGNQMFVAPTKKAEEIIYWEKNMSIADENYSIEERKAARFKLLDKVYKETNGHQGTFVNIQEIGTSLGFSNYLTRITYDYLSGENLLEARALGGIVSLTHYGIIEYESAIENPSAQTTYFPPVNVINNILSVNTMINSQVQLASNNSSQTQTNEFDKDKIMNWILKLEETIKAENIKIEQNILDEVDSIKAILSTKNPKVNFIKESLGIIQNFLVGIASNYAFQQLLKSFPM